MEETGNILIDIKGRPQDVAYLVDSETKLVIPESVYYRGELTFKKYGCSVLPNNQGVLGYAYCPFDQDELVLIARYWNDEIKCWPMRMPRFTTQNRKEMFALAAGILE